MSFFNFLKGVFNKMIGRSTIQEAIKLTPAVSDTMQDAIEKWNSMYCNQADWLNEKVRSLGISSLVASEKARMATLELEIKITGESERANVIRDSFQDVLNDIRSNLEYGIALGGFVIKPFVKKSVADNKYHIEFSYTKANNFYPLAFSVTGKILSAAFIDRYPDGDKVYSKVEIHRITDSGVVVENKAFVADVSTGRIPSVLGKEVPLSSVLEWEDIQPITLISGIDTLLFAYFKNPEANTIDTTSPLGASGFSRAVGLIKNADEQYSNLLWEFEGGQLAIDVDRTALIPLKNTEGNDKLVLPKLQDRLYRRTLDLGDDYVYNVFSPSLRDSSILNGLNNILMHIEDVTSLARGTISEVTMSEARTATELKILKQRAFSANADVQKELQRTFEQVFKVMDIYCDLYNIAPDGKYEVAYKWDDSIIIDKDAERQSDLLDIRNGLMSKVEYRMKWYGETETQAIESIELIKKEHSESLATEVRATTAPDSELETEKEQEQDKLERAHESNEPTTPAKTN